MDLYTLNLLYLQSEDFLSYQSLVVSIQNHYLPNTMLVMFLENYRYEKDL